MSKQLSSFTPQANAVVIGASGGIGRAVVTQLQQEPGIGNIHALSRSPIENAGSKVSSGAVDLLDESSIESAVEMAAQSGPFDLVFVATGILHRGEDLRPEKSMREFNAASMLEVFNINTIGPTLVAKHSLAHMRRGHKSVFAALSARVGSIGDNRLGGWGSYRASKSALNMLLRTLAIEQNRRSSETIVVGLHPGTVSTELSAPFTARVPAAKLFAPKLAAQQLLGVIDQLDGDDSGHVFAWDGSRIEP